MYASCRDPRALRLFVSRMFFLLRERLWYISKIKRKKAKRLIQDTHFRKKIHVLVERFWLNLYIVAIGIYLGCFSPGFFFTVNSIKSTSLHEKARVRLVGGLLSGEYTITQHRNSVNE